MTAQTPDAIMCLSLISEQCSRTYFRISLLRQRRRLDISAPFLSVTNWGLLKETPEKVPREIQAVGCCLGCSWVGRPEAYGRPSRHLLLSVHVFSLQPVFLFSVYMMEHDSLPLQATHMNPSHQYLKADSRSLGQTMWLVQFGRDVLILANQLWSCTITPTWPARALLLFQFRANGQQLAWGQDG